MGTATTLLKKFPDDLWGAPLVIHFLCLILLHQTFIIFLYPVNTQQILANTGQAIINQASTNNQMEPLN